MADASPQTFQRNVARRSPPRRQSTIGAMKASLDALEAVVGITPVFGCQLGRLVGIAKSIVGTVEQHHLNKAALHAFASKLCETMQVVAAALNSNIDDVPHLNNDLERVQKVIEEISQELNEHYQRYSITRFVLTVTKDTEDMAKEFCSRLDAAMGLFHFTANIQLRIGMQRIQNILQSRGLNITSGQSFDEKVPESTNQEENRFKGGNWNLPGNYTPFSQNYADNMCSRVGVKPLSGEVFSDEPGTYDSPLDNIFSGSEKVIGETGIPRTMPVPEYGFGNNYKQQQPVESARIPFPVAFVP